MIKRSSAKSIDGYGVTVGEPDKKGNYVIYYPTFCQVEGKGLRLYAFKYIFGGDKKIRYNSGYEVSVKDLFDVVKAAKTLKIKDVTKCRTVKLVPQ